MMNHDQICAAVRTSTVEVFQTMLGMEVTCGQPFVEKQPPGPSEGLIAVVGLAGRYMGSGSFCCSRDAAIRISAQFLMAEYDDISDDVLDAISEITNMVIGNFKNHAEVFLGPLGLSIPTVVYGFSFCARSAGKEQWTVLPFESGDIHFEVKIFLTPNRGLPIADTHPEPVEQTAPAA